MKQMMVDQFQRMILKNKSGQLGGLLPHSEMCFISEALKEEISEMMEAYDAGDIVGVVDAIVDLDFFLKGLIFKHGLSGDVYDRCFAAVYEKNMKKEPGVKDGRSSLGVVDAVKPQGWVGPEAKIRLILQEAMDNHDRT